MTGGWFCDGKMICYMWNYVAGMVYVAEASQCATVDQFRQFAATRRSLTRSTGKADISQDILKAPGGG